MSKEKNEENILFARIGKSYLILRVFGSIIWLFLLAGLTEYFALKWWMSILLFVVVEVFFIIITSICECWEIKNIKY